MENVKKFRLGRIFSIFISFVFALVLLFNVTGALADRTPGDFNYMQGMDLPGQDYKVFFTKAYPSSGDSILDCEKACANDPQCLAYTWVRPGVKGTNAACYLKSGVPVWTPNGDCCSGVRRGVSVTGLFNINQGMKSNEYIYKNFSFVGYEDKCERACASDPKCVAFTYSAPTWVGPSQPAYDLCYLMSGVPTLGQDPNCISGVRIMVANAPSTGPDTGTLAHKVSVAEKKDVGGAKSYSVSAAQKSGLAVAIVAKIPNVSGQWKSSIGLLYNITQKGNQFEWTVTKSSEKGQGVVKGNEVSASWSSPQGSGSSTGQITGIDPTGKATQIDWKNGVRFYR